MLPQCRGGGSMQRSWACAGEATWFSSEHPSGDWQGGGGVEMGNSFLVCACRKYQYQEPQPLFWSRVVIKYCHSWSGFGSCLGTSSCQVQSPDPWVPSQDMPGTSALLWSHMALLSSTYIWVASVSLTQASGRFMSHDWVLGGHSIIEYSLWSHGDVTSPHELMTAQSLLEEIQVS